MLIFSSNQGDKACLKPEWLKTSSFFLSLQSEQIKHYPAAVFTGSTEDNPFHLLLQSAFLCRYQPALPSDVQAADYRAA